MSLLHLGNDYKHNRLNHVGAPECINARVEFRFWTSVLLILTWILETCKFTQGSVDFQIRDVVMGAPVGGCHKFAARKFFYTWKTGSMRSFLVICEARKWLFVKSVAVASPNNCRNDRVKARNYHLTPTLENISIPQEIDEESIGNRVSRLHFKETIGIQVKKSIVFGSLQRYERCFLGVFREFIDLFSRNTIKLST